MTTKHHPANERVKREYYAYLSEARGRDVATIDSVAKSLARFEASTKARDFKRFHREQAVAFKAALAQQRNARTGERISKATMLSTLRDLRAFFFWLAHLPGFKSAIAYADADYFSLSDKDVAVARARRDKAVPTLEQVHHVLSIMPGGTVLERRDRALIALAAMTGARVGALASFRLGHVDLAADRIDHDARTVRTKFSKTFATFLVPIGNDARGYLDAWCAELARDHLFGPGDPLFPATARGLDAVGLFTATGIARHGWATSAPVREIFRRAFKRAGLPYFHPHSFRHTLVHYAMALDLTPEAMKALSQNLGHKDVLTTFTSYGQIPVHRQGELIRATGKPRATGPVNDATVAVLEGLLATAKAGASAAL